MKDAQAGIVGFGSNAVGQTGCAREGSETIIHRRLRENEGRAELYQWLTSALNKTPISKDAEEALWTLLTRERPY